jgi:hypothetical protein
VPVKGTFRVLSKWSTRFLKLVKDQ